MQHNLLDSSVDRKQQGIVPLILEWWIVAASKLLLWLMPVVLSTPENVHPGHDQCLYYPNISDRCTTGLLRNGEVGVLLYLHVPFALFFLISVLVRFSTDFIYFHWCIVMSNRCEVLKVAFKKYFCLSWIVNTCAKVIAVSIILITQSCLYMFINVMNE